MRPCPEYIECMNTVLDGEATPAQEAALSAHLARCPACAALYEDLKALRAGSAALIVQAPESLKADVMSRITDQSPKVVSFPAKAGKKPVRRWRSWAAAAAVFALIVGVGARQFLPVSGSSAPAVLDLAQSADGARSGSLAEPGQDPAPQSAEPSSYGTAPANTEHAAGESFKSAQPVTSPDMAQSSALTDLRAAMELVVARICGESGYTLETDYVMNLHGLAPYCDFRLLDGGSVLDEGRVTYTGLSANEAYLCFSWTWEGQSPEDALLYRYAVPADLSYVMWAGDTVDMENYRLALEN